MLIFLEPALGFREAERVLIEAVLTVLEAALRTIETARILSETAEKFIEDLLTCEGLNILAP